MKTIVRIEHPSDGYGIWRSEDRDFKYRIDSLKCYKEIGARHSKFPVPREDGLILRRNQFCAFKSVEQLQQWVEKDWIKEIIEVGFKVLLLDVSKWVEGEFQVVFKKEDILLSKDISQLFM